MAHMTQNIVWETVFPFWFYKNYTVRITQQRIGLVDQIVFSIRQYCLIHSPLGELNGWKLFLV